jgi:hypothetical protein
MLQGTQHSQTQAAFAACACYQSLHSSSNSPACSANHQQPQETCASQPAGALGASTSAGMAARKRS